MRLAWMTDIHLNFLDSEAVTRFLRRVAKMEVDRLLIAGDIGEADSLLNYLSAIHDLCPVPIYFVLGNHDYYRGSVEYLRSKLPRFLAANPRLTWLGDSPVISLTDSTALIGHDSWADGRLGDYAKSTVELNDFALIGEFLGCSKFDRLSVMQKFAEQAAKHFEVTLPQALSKHSRVIIVTHVPPFEGATWHRGKISAPDWLPLFSCKVVGEVLSSIMQQHPEKQAVVLCGHTHSGGEYYPLPNLQVLTGTARYGHPKIQQLLTID